MGAYLCVYYWGMVVVAVVVLAVLEQLLKSVLMYLFEKLDFHVGAANPRGEDIGELHRRSHVHTPLFVCFPIQLRQTPD